VDLLPAERPRNAGCGNNARPEIDMNILIVEARYHPDVTQALVDSATAALEKGGATFERVAVPGVLELPAAIAIAVKSPRPFDGYVALGSVAGHAQTTNMFYAETMRGLVTLSTMGIALGQGIVLASDEGSARDLAMTHDIGGDAARACLALVTFGERLGYMR
jgi:6,7-dimethyl-8-ribityllumazine synthase